MQQLLINTATCNIFDFVRNMYLFIEVLTLKQFCILTNPFVVPPHFRILVFANVTTLNLNDLVKPLEGRATSNQILPVRIKQSTLTLFGPSILQLTFPFSPRRWNIKRLL